MTRWSLRRRPSDPTAPASAGSRLIPSTSSVRFSCPPPSPHPRFGSRPPETAAAMGGAECAVVEEEERDDSDTNSEFDDATDSEGSDMEEPGLDTFDGEEERWVSEVEATVERAVEENHAIDNLRLELKTLKFTFEHRTFSESTVPFFVLRFSFFVRLRLSFFFRAAEVNKQTANSLQWRALRCAR